MKKHTNRLEIWEKERRVNIPIDKLEALNNDKELRRYFDMRGIISLHEKKNTSIDELIRTAKEIIFDVKGEKVSFDFISYTLDPESFELVIGKTWSLIDTFEEEEERLEYVKSILMRASIEEVPVYPNTTNAEIPLGRYYKDLLLNGVLIQKEEGSDEKVRIINEFSPKEKIEKPEYLLDLNMNISVSPAELVIIKQSIKDKISRLNSAEQILFSLEFAIKELESLLKSAERNENGIQSCLTTNPILFGLEYSKIIPKHKFGSDFISDYALIKHSGLIDIVEIESSNLPLYNNNGNPSQHLVHAEQQVLDWIEWVETNNPYANQKLPGMSSPIGYIIIGRTENLNDINTLKLQRRNISFRGNIIILTYDNLLDRAKKIQGILLNNKNAEQNNV